VQHGLVRFEGERRERANLEPPALLDLGDLDAGSPRSFAIFGERQDVERFDL
jgi:hypothetical protein